MEAIITTCISAFASVVVGLFSYAAVKSSNEKANMELLHKMELAQARTDEKITELTREVREHNNFAKRVPVLEEKVDRLEHYHTPSNE